MSCTGPAHAIALVGMPGGGKSTVGRQLAKQIGWRFVDCDQEIERRIGCSIRHFFERDGELAFRDLEAEVLDSLTGQGDTVLATGGGAVLRAANRQILHARSFVIYLHSTTDELFRRLRHDSQRPLLQVDDPLGKLKDLYVERDPLYREVAHLVLETGRGSIGALVQLIKAQVKVG